MAKFVDEFVHLRNGEHFELRTHILYSDGRPAIWHKNTLYLCPNCGITWAQRIFAGVPKVGWTCRERRCEACGDGTLAIQPADYNATNSFRFLSRELILLKRKLPDEPSRPTIDPFEHAGITYP